jgi:hypothetical protein
MDATYKFLFKTARVIDGKVEIFGEFMDGELDGARSWIWFEDLQRRIDNYCQRSGDTIEQAVERFNREIDEKRQSL